MANSLTSNVTRRLMRIFLKHFESNRVVTKTVNTQLFEGKFTPAAGTTVDIKRPHDYRTVRTAGGDISSAVKDDIISGKATATVQNYFTSATEWGNVEEALELDQLDQIIAPMARRIVTDLETDFAQFMLENSGLVHGTPGTAVTVWSDVAEAGALLSSIGVPGDMPWYYLMNPFTQVVLANQQATVIAGPDGLIRTAWENAQIARDFGGMRALTSNALGSVTIAAIADAAGAVNGVPTATYVAAKDSMQQTIIVDGFGTFGGTLPAGSVVQIGALEDTALLNQSTRNAALDGAGANIPWRGVTVSDAAFTSGAATLVVSSPAIFEADVAYNTVNNVIEDDDVLDILTEGATFSPNLFYHPQAFSMASVKLPKLFSTDTTVTTEDGFSLRVSKYADGDANQQKVRFDLLPAYAVLNPWFAGHGWKT